MSIPYEATGRTRQKARTRDALIAAARQLLSEGVTPRVEEAAERAGISRTTAYRYFPNQRALLVATHPEIEKRSLLGENAPREVPDRLDAVLDEFIRILLETEPELRTALRLSLEPAASHREKLVLRRGRAIVWFEDALAPLRGELSESEIRRLVLALRSAVGIESLVWLTDVAGLSRSEAVELMRWSAHALLQVSLTTRGRNPAQDRAGAG